MAYCYINFEFRVETSISNKVFIVGDVPELGNWNSEKGY